MVSIAISTPIGGSLYTQMREYKNPSRKDVEGVIKITPPQDRDAHPHNNYKNKIRESFPKDRNCFENTIGSTIDSFV